MSFTDKALLRRHKKESRKVVNFKGDGTKSSTTTSSQRAQTREELSSIRKSLPIYEHRQVLVESIRKNRNLILVGETGSGKTTQIPQYLYEEGFAKKGMIAVTQPRRVAAITVADRVAQECGVELGAEVGYTIRFDDKTSDKTKIKYMTDGMLLREIQLDPMLRRYTTILLDEAHERTLNTDILFALLKKLQIKRPELRVIAMSATLDADKFSTYFNNAPVAIVPGRTFRVDSYFTKDEATDISEAAITTVLQIHQEKPLDGDILVFLSGAEEIEAARRGIEERAKALPSTAPQIVVFPLYSTLSPDVQLQAFTPTPAGHRKVVVATNIAETSITLHGIKYVVDSGRAKVKAFHQKTGLETLAEQIISRAEAFQRSGRSGREREGECFRLYPEEFFKTMPASVEPEILRTPMTAAVLQLKALGIDDIRSFDFIDKPSSRILKKAVLELLQLEALDMEGKITDLGRAMVEFPVEPCYARILIASARPPILGDSSSDAGGGGGAKAKTKTKEGLPVFPPCSDEMVTLVAALSVDSLLTTPPRGTTMAAKRTFAKYIVARNKFVSPFGDLITSLEILRQYEAALPALRDRWCKENFVNPRNAAMALKVRLQLVEILESRGYPLVSCRFNAEKEKERSISLTADSDFATDVYEPVRKCLITGLANKLAKRQYDGTYAMMNGTDISIHPSSCIHGRTMSGRAAGSAGAGTIGGVQVGQTLQSKHSFVPGRDGVEKPKKHPYECLLYHELVFTTKNYIRGVVAVDEEWLYEVAPRSFDRSVSHESGKSAALKEFEDFNSSKHSHTNTLMKGQRTAFANLQSKALPSTVSLSVSGSSHVKHVASKVTSASSHPNPSRQNHSQQHHSKPEKRQAVHVNTNVMSQSNVYTPKSNFKQKSHHSHNSHNHSHNYGEKNKKQRFF